MRTFILIGAAALALAACGDNTKAISIPEQENVVVEDETVLADCPPTRTKARDGTRCIPAERPTNTVAQ